MALLETNLIQLRALEPDDLGVLYNWENNSEWWEMGNSINPYSKYILREYIVSSDKTIYENKQLRLMITLKHNGETIGMIDLYDYDPHHHRAGIGVLIDKAYQKQGYAKDALDILLPYCFDFLAMHSVYVHINVDNEASIKLFEGLGFQKSGLLKQWTRRMNEYVDVLVYQKLKD